MRHRGGVESTRRRAPGGVEVTSLNTMGADVNSHAAHRCRFTRCGPTPHGKPPRGHFPARWFSSIPSPTSAFSHYLLFTHLRPHQQSATIIAHKQSTTITHKHHEINRLPPCGRPGPGRRCLRRKTPIHPRRHHPRYQRGPQPSRQDRPEGAWRTRAFRPSRCAPATPPR